MTERDTSRRDLSAIANQQNSPIYRETVKRLGFAQDVEIMLEDGSKIITSPDNPNLDRLLQAYGKKS